MKNIAYIMTDTAVSAVINGKSFVVESSNEHYPAILTALREHRSPDEVEALFDKAKVVRQYLGGNTDLVMAGGDVPMYKGQPVPDVLAGRLLEFMKKQLPIEPLLRFLERLFRNPSFRSRAQLYKFLELCNLPITEDGTFLAYKAINHNWTDKHTGKEDNHIGNTLEMPRGRVDDDPDSGCSYGYHAGNLEYVKGFACGYGTSDGDRIVLVEIDPENVVSVPKDCSYSKMRVCKYKVLAEFTQELPGTYVSRDQAAASDTYDPCPDCGDDPCTCNDEGRLPVTITGLHKTSGKVLSRTYNTDSEAETAWQAFNIVGEYDQLKMTDANGDEFEY